MGLPSDSFPGNSKIFVPRVSFSCLHHFDGLLVPPSQNQVNPLLNGQIGSKRRPRLKMAKKKQMKKSAFECSFVPSQTMSSFCELANAEIKIKGEGKGEEGTPAAILSFISIIIGLPLCFVNKQVWVRSMFFPQNCRKYIRKMPRPILQKMKRKMTLICGRGEYGRITM